MIVKDLKPHKNATTWKGAEFQIRLNSNPKNLTGVSLKAEIRYGNENGPLAKTLTDGDGITITDAALGKFEFDSFFVEFSKPGTYVYDVRFTEGADSKIYVGGSWEITGYVTRKNG
jgi:hypothetical protein